MRAVNYISLLPPVNNKSVVLEKYQETNDIIHWITKNHLESARDYDKISESFWKGNGEKTARCLFDFCKKYILYKIEPDKSQSVKTPARILHDGHGDCKHYASFINGVLDSLRRKGYDVKPIYRFASYKIFDSQPQHVFSVMKIGGREIFIDPVLKSFDEHKRYYFSSDKIPPMLYKLSGVDEMGRTKKTKTGKKPKLMLKIALAPSRNSFLLLVKINTFSLATKMFAAMKDPAKKAKILNAWKNIGGKEESLLKNIQAGVNTYNKLHKKKGKKITGIDDYVELADINYMKDWESPGDVYGYIDRGMSGIGVVQFAGAAAIIAAATPILLKLKDLLKGLGINTKKVQESTEEAGLMVKDAVEEQKGGSTEKTEQMAEAMRDAGLSVQKVAVDKTTDQDGNQQLEMSQPPGRVAPSSTGSSISDMLSNVKDWVMRNKKPMLYVGGGVLALYVVPKIIRAVASGKKKGKR